MIKNLHNPPHLFIDYSPYFISSACYQKQHFLATDKIKEDLMITLQQCFAEKEWPLNDRRAMLLREIQGLLSPSFTHLRSEWGMP